MTARVANYVRLIDVLERQRPPPCVRCFSYDACARLRLACDQFRAYIRGAQQSNKKTSKAGKRKPSEYHYDCLFIDRRVDLVVRIDQFDQDDS